MSSGAVQPSTRWLLSADPGLPPFTSAWRAASRSIEICDVATSRWKSFSTTISFPTSIQTVRSCFRIVFRSPSCRCSNSVEDTWTGISESTWAGVRGMANEMWYNWWFDTVQNRIKGKWNKKVSDVEAYDDVKTRHQIVMMIISGREKLWLVKNKRSISNQSKWIIYGTNVEIKLTVIDNSKTARRRRRRRIFRRYELNVQSRRSVDQKIFWDFMWLRLWSYSEVAVCGTIFQSETMCIWIGYRNQRDENNSPRQTIIPVEIPRRIWRVW